MRQVSIVEQMVMNTDHLPQDMKEWRCYRIEYGFEDSSPEGLVWLPPEADANLFEQGLNRALKHYSGSI